MGEDADECLDSWLKIVDTKGRSDEQVEDATHDTALYTTIRLGYEKGVFSLPKYFISAVHLN